MADTQSNKTSTSTTAGGKTLPARNEDIPARDLDPDFNSGSLEANTPPVDMSASYGKSSTSSSGSGAKGEVKDAAQKAGREAGDAAQRAGDEAKQSAADLARQAKEAGGRVGDQAKQAYEDARQFTSEAVQRGREQAGQYASQATSYANSYAEQQKGRLAGGIDDAALAARRVVDSLRERGDDGVAAYAATVADGLEGARDYLRDADVGELLSEGRRFTKRHPEWVLGGMFVAGLAVARFLKADRPGGGRIIRGRSSHPGDESLFRDIERSQQGEYPHAFEDIERRNMGRSGGAYAYGDDASLGSSAAMGAAGTGAFSSRSPVGLDNPAGHTQPGMPGQDDASHGSTGGSKQIGEPLGGSATSGSAVDDRPGDDVGGMGVTDTRNASPAESGDTKSNPADTGKTGGML